LVEDRGDAVSFGRKTGANALFGLPAEIKGDWTKLKIAPLDAVDEEDPEGWKLFIPGEWDGKMTLSEEDSNNEVVWLNYW